MKQPYNQTTIIIHSNKVTSMEHEMHMHSKTPWQYYGNTLMR